MQQQIKLKPDSGAFLQTLWGFVFSVLVMLGIGGTIYKLVSHEGWIARLLGGGLPGGSAAFMALAALGLLAWFSPLWTTHRTQGRMADWVVHGFAFAGFIYALRLWGLGTL